MEQDSVIQTLAVLISSEDPRDVQDGVARILALENAQGDVRRQLLGEVRAKESGELRTHTDPV